MADQTPILSSAAYTQQIARNRDVRLQKRMKSILWFIVALILAFTFFFPLYFMVSSSFKAENEVLATPVRLLPENFQGLANYQKAFDAVPLGRFFFNSTLMASVDVIVTVFFSAMAGYGFAKFNFRGRRLLFIFVLSTITVPFQILIVPLFIQIRALGWDDSYAGLIIPGIMNAFGVFMLRQFAYSIPDELLDAARIDGANEFRIFRQIVFPLLAPASASLAIIIFLFSWNNFLWPLIVTNSVETRPLTVGLQVFSSTDQGVDWSIITAATLMTSAPLLVGFLLFQRQFVQSFMRAGIR